MASTSTKIYKGKWWLPTNSRKKIYGALEINSGGELILSLDGHLLKANKIEDTLQEIVLGNTDQGKITLFINNLLSTGYSREGYQHTTIQAQYILTNLHAKKINGIKFKEINLCYPNLFNWFNERVADIKQEDNSIIINNTAPQEFLYKLKGFDLTFTIYTTWGGKPLSPIDVEIKERIFLKVKFNKLKTFEEILDIEKQIRNFLSFTIGINTLLDNISLIPSTKKKINNPFPVEVVRGKTNDTKL